MSQKTVVKRSSGGSLNLPSALAFLWIIRRAKRRQDPDRPQIVSLDPKSKAVLERARQLAGEGREDAGAVAELRTLAHSRRRTLRAAERASRMAGYHHELRQANLANRLLQAALTRVPTPKALSAREQERIEAIESFRRLSRPEQWARLIDAQPALVELEAGVRDGRFGETSIPSDLLRARAHVHDTAADKTTPAATRSSSSPPFNVEQKMRLQRYANAHIQLARSLQPLVGPCSGQHDPVLGSQSALEVAEHHLRQETTREAD